MKMGIVHWVSSFTGYKGHGSPMPYDKAVRNAKLENEKCKRSFHHWVEKVESDEVENSEVNNERIN